MNMTKEGKKEEKCALKKKRNEKNTGISETDRKKENQTNENKVTNAQKEDKERRHKEN